MDKNNLRCPFCQQGATETYGTYKEESLSFRQGKAMKINDTVSNGDDEILVQFFACPNADCHKISIDIQGVGKQFPDKGISFYPLSEAIQFPDYVPQVILEDYNEACAILNLSPKASATLSRRCLQGMIRDFWGVTGKSLFDEIKLIEDKVDVTTRKVLDALRQLGNIGAHPEKDVNLIVDIQPGEALKLIRFIEVLIKGWYVERAEKEALLQNILTINDDKQLLRRK
ncbi:hypothetical protein Javan173_0052 [Streptococcus phage Javan173]|uniref:DUF4145 domain-containing protein n=1 Tax=Streptococcus entericus TaxID=155680 RepID=UPI000369F23E|nr:DUF4145 domain-containing protein [Streptococcus entericus]QBX15181.1 hypothetical protein Javan173_0052 [Streptococcus phage Javan173]